MTPVQATSGATDRAARQLLGALAAVDLVSGVACIVLAGPLGRWLGLDNPAYVAATGVALLGLAATGAMAWRARPHRLAALLRRQAALDAAFAGLLVGVAIVGGADRTGAALLVATAAAVVMVAAAQSRLAQRAA
jgi:uncharacterized iron-regulated membrane protein